MTKKPKCEKCESLRAFTKEVVKEIKAGANPDFAFATLEQIAKGNIP